MAGNVHKNGSADDTAFSNGQDTGLRHPP
jgi:hypothetical protein